MKKTAYLVSAILLLLNCAAASSGSTSSAGLSKYLFAAILAPFAASIIIACFYRYLGDLSAYLGAFSGLVSLAATFQLYGANFSASYSWIPSIGASFGFYVDGLSLLIATLASGIGVLIFVYSRVYMDHGARKRKYYTVLTAFMGSMIGLVFSSNLFMLFLFWEFTSICSFLLISHKQRTLEGIYASKKSLIITVGSGMTLLAGFLILGETAGTYNMAEMLKTGNMAQMLSEKSLYLPVLGLIGLGAGAKSAQVPLHIWLPDAMEAPTPVSAFLHSATMVKAGVFLIARFRPILMPGEYWSTVFIVLGLTTMTIAAFLAVAASQLKELLAYSTASHLGLIVAGLGFSSVLGAETAVFHILNHAVFKAALFMIAGIVLHELGTQKISKLSGLRRRWPLTALAATIAGFSMAGIPPLNGFYSKELLFESSYYFATHNGGFAWLVPATAVLGSVFTFIYSFRFVSVFYGKKTIDIPDLSRLIVVPPLILAFTALIIGLAPNRVIGLIVNPALASISLNAHGMSVHLPTSLKPAFVMTLITVSLGLIGFKERKELNEYFNQVLEVRLLNANFYYHSFLELSDRSSDFAVNLTESGLLRTYAVWTLVISSLMTLAGYLISNAIPAVSINVSLPLVIVLSTALASVYAVIKADSYIAAVLTLSILGFMVSIYYLLMDAPDLVMTQLVVETLSLIIFLLVLDRLPELRKKISASRNFRDLLIAMLSGFAVFASIVYAKMSETPKEIAEYYVENALPGSGGTNVVNVILVDFRGVDTMGEISVIAMAGIAILMLFEMRGEKK